MVRNQEEEVQQDGVAGVVMINRDGSSCDKATTHTLPRNGLDVRRLDRTSPFPLSTFPSLHSANDKIPRPIIFVWYKAIIKKKLDFRHFGWFFFTLLVAL